MKVAIIYNKEVSQVINIFGRQNKEIYNPKTVNRVAKALEEGGHNVAMIDGDMHVIERIQNFMPRVLEGERMGMVFNMAYGIQGESRYTHIPSMLEMLGIPYVGSSPSGHALALDKVITKIILQKHNIPTPDFWVFANADEGFSTFVLEIDLEGDPEAIQTLENKTTAPRNKICPAHISEKIAADMTRYSIEAFRALQLHDFARIDLRMDEDGNIYILEINSMASLGPTGSYPKAASVAGYEYKTLVNKMLDVAALRYFTSAEVPVDELQQFKKAPLQVRISKKTCKY
jgi:D-alanine-D-alanine ligase-like ATP-grasp enzyme